MRKGARLEGKAKATELLIKSVRFDQPKMLIGWSQNGKWLDNSRYPWDYRDT